MNKKKILSGLSAFVVGYGYIGNNQANQIQTQKNVEQKTINNQKNENDNLGYLQKDVASSFSPGLSKTKKLSFADWLKSQEGKSSYEQWKKTSDGYLSLNKEFKKTVTYEKGFKDFAKKEAVSDEEYSASSRTGYSNEQRDNFEQSTAFRNAVLNYGSTKNIVEHKYETTDEFSTDVKAFVEDNNLKNKTWWHQQGQTFKNHLMNSDSRVLRQLYAFWAEKVFENPNKYSPYFKLHNGDLKYSYHQIAKEGFEKSTQAQTLLANFQRDNYQEITKQNFLNLQYEKPTTDWSKGIEPYYGYWQDYGNGRISSFTLSPFIREFEKRRWIPREKYYHVTEHAKNINHYKNFGHYEFQKEYNNYVDSKPQKLIDEYIKTEDYQNNLQKHRDSLTISNWYDSGEHKSYYDTWRAKDSTQEKFHENWKKQWSSKYWLYLFNWSEKDRRYEKYMSKRFPGGPGVWFRNRPSWFKKYQNIQGAYYRGSWKGNLQRKKLEIIYEADWKKTDDYKKKLMYFEKARRKGYFIKDADVISHYNTIKARRTLESYYQSTDDFKAKLIDYYKSSEKARDAGKAFYLDSEQIATDIDDNVRELALKEWRKTVGYKTAYKQWASSFANGKEAWIKSSYFQWLYNSLYAFESRPHPETTKSNYYETHQTHLFDFVYKDKEILGFKGAPKGKGAFPTKGRWWNFRNLADDAHLRTMKQVIYTGTNAYKTKFATYKSTVPIEFNWKVLYRGTPEYNRAIAAFLNPPGRSGTSSLKDEPLSKEDITKKYEKTLEYKTSLDAWEKAQNQGLELFKNSGYANSEYKKYLAQ